MKKVLCTGTFDILHKGHKKFLKDAKKQGSYLIVIVISDEAVLENKNRLPVNNQEKRAKAIEDFGIADKIIKVSKDFNANLKSIAKINPDVIVVGYDQMTKNVEKIKKYLDSKGIHPKYYVSKEFSEGIHSRYLRK